MSLLKVKKLIFAAPTELNRLMTAQRMVIKGVGGVYLATRAVTETREGVIKT